MLRPVSRRARGTVGRHWATGGGAQEAPGGDGPGVAGRGNGGRPIHMWCWGSGIMDPPAKSMAKETDRDWRLVVIRAHFWASFTCGSLAGWLVI